MNKTKKYVTIGAVLLCICAAVYLNWSYNNGKGVAALSDAELANAKAAEEAMEGGLDLSVSNYFAEARLTRQQSRDEALELLKAAAASEMASQETIDGAMSAIAAMANYSMLETQIENLLLAKNFAECVAFITADGVTLAVPSPEEGLSPEEVAKITDAIVAETDYMPTQIRVIEVKSSTPPTATTAPSSAPTIAPTAAPTEAPTASPSPAPNANNPAAGMDGESYDETGEMFE